jgi:hypothetical protein
MDVHPQSCCCMDQYQCEALAKPARHGSLLRAKVSLTLNQAPRLHLSAYLFTTSRCCAEGSRYGGANRRVSTHQRIRLSSILGVVFREDPFPDVG